MKILLLSSEYPPDIGGVANYYGNLVKNWPEPEKITVIDRLSGELFFSHRLFPWLKTSFFLKKKIKQKEFDYFLIGQILPLGTAAFLTSLFYPHKYAIILHGLDFNLSIKNRWKRFLSKLIISRADKIICANTYLQSIVKDFFPKDNKKIFVINPGIIVEKPKIELDLLQKLKDKHFLENNFIILSLGRLVRRKGFDNTILALKNINKDLKIKYILAGDGPDKNYLQTLVKDNKIEDRIIFLGSVSEEEKWVYLDLAHLFIMPARQIDLDFEGFGIVYLEANLFKKAVIAGDSGGVRDAVEHEVNGLLVNPDKIEEIESAILRLYYDPSLLKTLGEQGYQRLYKFKWDRLAKKFQEIIIQN